MADSSTLVDRVKIFVESSGTGPFVLGNSVPAFRGVEALIDGRTYSYAVESGSTYEAGRGVFVEDVGQLLRSPEISSNNGGPVAFPANVMLAFTALASDWVTALPGSGTVTSVGASGGTTGLSFSGGPIETAGTLALEGTLVPEHGGTGVTSLIAAKEAMTLGNLKNEISAWPNGGGRNFDSNVDVNSIASGINSAINLGGRGWANDPNRIPGLLERNSYNLWSGYWKTGQTDIGGVIYDQMQKSTDINPNAVPELGGNLGGGDCWWGALASFNVGSFHCGAGLYGAHNWNVGCTYSIVDGYYTSNYGSTDSNNFGNRSGNFHSAQCRIGTQGTDTATGIANASLVRHSANYGSDQSTIDAAYCKNNQTRLSGHIRDFGVNEGFGTSSEIFNARNWGWSDKYRGDNQASEVLLSRLCTGGTAVTLNAHGDWVVAGGSTTQQNNNANGNITVGTNTFAIAIFEVLARQRGGGTGYYSSKVKAIIERDGSGNGTLIDIEEFELMTNKSDGNPITSWVADATIHATTGLLSVRFKALAGESAFVSANLIYIRQRTLTGTPLVPPIPFALKT